MDEDGSIGQWETQRGGFGFRELMLDGDERHAQFLCEFTMSREVELVFPKNLFVDQGLKQVVDVIAAQVRVAIGRKHLIDVALSGGNELENGNIKGAATEIIDRHAA